MYIVASRPQPLAYTVPFISPPAKQKNEVCARISLLSSTCHFPGIINFIVYLVYGRVISAFALLCRQVKKCYKLISLLEIVI